MGGKNSQPTRKVTHFYFGQALRKRSFNKQVICVIRPIMDRGEFDEWKQKYDIVTDMNKEHLLVPETYDCRKIETSKVNCGGCCGAQAEYQMTYDDVDFTMFSQISNRKSKKRPYTEPELMLLLYNLLQGARQFQKKVMHVGDIRTKNILITKLSEVKMVNIASFPSQRTSIQKVLDGFDNVTKFYFAPEQIQYLKTKGSPFGKDQYPNPKTEAWSVGLCILQAATLECSEQLYDTTPQGRKLNTELLTQRMKKVEQTYKNVHDFLATIVKIDSSLRMTSGQCWASLRPYSQKITELQTFKRNPTAENTSIRKFQTEGSGRK